MQYVKVAAHGLIKKDGKFLVTRRSSVNDYMPLMWDIPGGTIDFGEKSSDALTREIAEETGLKVKVKNVIFCHDFLSNPERHQFQLVFECDYESGEVTLNPEEHDDFCWVSVEEMKDLNKIAFFRLFIPAVTTKLNLNSRFSNYILNVIIKNSSRLP